MAGITVDMSGWDGYLAALERIESRARNMEPALEELADSLKDDVETALRGSTFAPLSPLARELAQRHGGGSQPLQGLRGSIRTNVNRDTAEVYSTHPWAERLHKGSDNQRVFGSRSLHRLPARPFLPLDTSGNINLDTGKQREIGERLISYLLGEFGDNR